VFIWPKASPDIDSLSKVAATPHFAKAANFHKGTINNRTPAAGANA
jgi:hypothetical protein